MNFFPSFLLFLRPRSLQEVFSSVRLLLIAPDEAISSVGPHLSSFQKGRPFFAYSAANPAVVVFLAFFRYSTSMDLELLLVLLQPSNTGFEVGPFEDPLQDFWPAGPKHWLREFGARLFPRPLFNFYKVPF